MIWNHVESDGGKQRKNRSTTHNIKLNLCALLPHSNLWNLPVTDYRSKRLRCLHRIPSATLLLLSQRLLSCKRTIISHSSEATSNINLRIHMQKAMSPLWRCHPKRNRSSSTAIFQVLIAFQTCSQVCHVKITRPVLAKPLRCYPHLCADASEIYCWKSGKDMLCLPHHKRQIATHAQHTHSQWSGHITK